MCYTFDEVSVEAVTTVVMRLIALVCRVTFFAQVEAITFLTTPITSTRLQEIICAHAAIETGSRFG